MIHSATGIIISQRNEKSKGKIKFFEKYFCGPVSGPLLLASPNFRVIIGKENGERADCPFLNGNEGVRKL